MSYHAKMTEPDDAASARAIPVDLPIYDAARLVGPEGTAMIVLDDKTYTLRITRASKLILTK